MWYITWKNYYKILPILYPILCVYMCAQKKAWENINIIPEFYYNKYYEKFLRDTLKLPFAKHMSVWHL